MEHGILETGDWDRRSGTDSFSTLMGTYLKVTSKTIRLMARVSIDIKAVKHTRGTGLMTCNTETVLKF